MRCLIVDDDAFVVMSCRRILEAEGATVNTAENVETGVAMLVAEPYDVMLTDIKMPGQDGFAMLERAKELQPDMPVLLMTGFLTAEIMSAGSRAGAAICIAKPFTPEELLQAVRKII